VFGADVTHSAAGISVAGVVATRGNDFATYFSEIRAQSPYVYGADKKRQRKAEEQIIYLAEMAEALLRRCRDNNNCRLPSTVLYYRDGVSDGQFKPVLTLEMNQLANAFQNVGGEGYHPQLVIIVGQKRHQTRFSSTSHKMARVGKGKDGKGKDGKGKGKGKEEQNQVPPGTVAGVGIAQPGHLNFSRVPRGHQGHIHPLPLPPSACRQTLGQPKHEVCAHG